MKKLWHVGGSTRDLAAGYMHVPPEQIARKPSLPREPEIG